MNFYLLETIIGLPAIGKAGTFFTTYMFEIVFFYIFKILTNFYILIVVPQILTERIMKITGKTAF